MARVPSIEQILWFASIACYAILLARLVISRLHVVYRYFFIYLVIRLGRSLLLAGLDRRSSAYGWAYVTTEPIIWVLYILVVLELFTNVLRGYPGIQTLSRRLLAAALAVSALVALVTLIPNLGNPAEHFPILRAMYVAQRLVMSSLVVFFTILTAFLVWYPVPLSRNVVVYCAGYCSISSVPRWRCLSAISRARRLRESPARFCMGLGGGLPDCLDSAS